MCWRQVYTCSAELEPRKVSRGAERRRRRKRRKSKISGFICSTKVLRLTAYSTVNVLLEVWHVRRETQK